MISKKLRMRIIFFASCTTSGYQILFFPSQWASDSAAKNLRIQSFNALSSLLLFTRIYQDPSMKILSWMAIGRGKKHTLINTFLKWWSSLILKTFTVPAETIPSPNLFHSSQTLLANLNFPTSKRYLFLNSLKLCPLLTPSPTTWKNLSGSKFSNPLSILKTSIKSARKNLVSIVVSPKILNLSS